MKSAVQRPSRIFRVVVSRSVNLVLPVAVFWMFSAGVTGSARAQTFSVLYNFVNGADGASPDRGSLVLDGAGNFYGTTYAGGLSSQGTEARADAKAGANISGARKFASSAWRRSRPSTTRTCGCSLNLWRRVERSFHGA